MKVQFQILFKLTKNKDAIMNEFLRRFLVNSMAMEGGTISHKVAKSIDEKKRINLTNINELDIPLYEQLKKNVLFNA